MQDLIRVLFAAEFLQISLRFSTPIMLAALGLVVNERSGVLNLSVEGMVLTGTFFAFLGALLTGNPWIGLGLAMSASLVLALVHSFCVISLGLNPVIVAVAINTFSLGMTSTLLRLFIGTQMIFQRTPGFSAVPWPDTLRNLPIIGTVIFEHHMFTYIGLILIGVLWFVFFKTTWGLEIRAVGEYPRAADTAGVKVKRLRYLCMMFSGLMCGMAGTAISLTGLNIFIDDMSAGYGWIAFACIIFGRFHPVGVASGALIFGLATGLNIRIQTVGIPIPYHIPLMLPYLIIILLLAIQGTGSVPASWAKPYFPDE